MPEEAELADGRGTDVLREPAAGGHDEHDVADVRVEPHRDVDDRAHVGAAEQRPRERVPQRGDDARPGDRLVPLIPRLASFALELRTDPDDSELLAGRRGRAEQEQVLREAVVRRDGLLDAALDAGPPRGGDHDRDREQRQEHEQRAHGDEQHERGRQPDDPAHRREQRHEQVVEREHLIAQHREAVEILGPLVMLDGRDRRLQGRDVGFERDGDLVAEPALHAGEHDAQEPRGRGRRRQSERGDDDAAAVVIVEPVGEELEPQRDQRVGDRHHDRHREREEQAARLGAVAELHRAPERAERRGQVVRRAFHAPPARRARRAPRLR